MPSLLPLGVTGLLIVQNSIIVFADAKANIFTIKDQFTLLVLKTNFKKTGFNLYILKKEWQKTYVYSRLSFK